MTPIRLKHTLPVLALLLWACSEGNTPITPSEPEDDAALASELDASPDQTPDQDDTSPDRPEVEDNPGCDADEACAEGEICEAGVCVEGCRFDGACGEGEICEDFECVAGCRNPADCGVGHTCRGSVCVQVGCISDEECGQGNRCVETGCVEIGAAECEGDDQCGFRWRCSVQGVCHEGGCLVHEDCLPSAWCRQALCEARINQTGQVRFERIHPEILGARRTHESLVYGVGGGFFDMDGDLKLDLFLGAWMSERDDPPCLFRNTSRPGRVGFEPVGPSCGFDQGQILAAGGVDVEGDGFDEVVLMGPSIARLERFHPAGQTIDLMATLDEDDPRRACLAGSLLATDIDLDGRVDLVIGCQARKIPNASTQTNIILRQNDAGGFEPAEGAGLEGLESNGVTLALGSIDINEDGLLDIIVINDTFVAGGETINALTTGTTLIRCGPGEGCLYEARGLGRGNRRWGSFMGVGNLAVHDLGEHLYITDWGPNRLIRYPGDEVTPLDIAEDLGVALAFSEETLLFAWSAIVEDFDRNGLDDLFITQGMAISADLPSYATHRDVLLLQRADGSFEALDETVGLEPHTHEDSGDEERVSSSRGAARADLDLDGHVELVVNVLEGRMRFYSEQPTPDNAPDRCTLVPRPRVVPTYGFGYAISGPERQTWRRRDMQGQMRFGASPWLLSTESRGVLRFPSGAEVSFDCEGGPGPIIVEEPDWIALEREGDRVLVSLDTPWLPEPPRVGAALRDRGGDERLEPAARDEARWAVPVQGDDRALMLNIDGRWVARWFAVP